MVSATTIETLTKIPASKHPPFPFTKQPLPSSLPQQSSLWFPNWPGPQNGFQGAHEPTYHEFIDFSEIAHLSGPSILPVQMISRLYDYQGHFGWVLPPGVLTLTKQLFLGLGKNVFLDGMGADTGTVIADAFSPQNQHCMLGGVAFFPFHTIGHIVDSFNNKRRLNLRKTDQAHTSIPPPLPKSTLYLTLQEAIEVQ